MLPRNVLLYGREEPLPAAVPLRAGPVDLIFEDGTLRYLRCGGREVVRRIYVAVRDPDWNTVPARISKLDIDAARDRFRISFEADHREGPVHFRWEALIEGAPGGRIAFSMAGKALADFRRNRIGFCVLHPLEGFAGRPCEIETIDGRRQAGVVPAEVEPHQPFRDLRAIFHEFAPGCRAEVSFDGEVFEMEDHRNWTDASFKTYGTPLSLPYPVAVPAGTVIRQRVQFQILGRPPRAVSAKGRPAVAIALDSGTKQLPELGVAARKEPWTPAPAQLDRLAALRLSHLRVEAPSLQTPPPEARPLGLPLESVLILGAEPRRQMEQAMARVRELGLTVRRWVVLSAQDPVTPPPLAALARQLLGGALIVGGTRGNFAELNRNRPAAGLFDGLCFPINPQVHSSDNSTMAENCAAQRDAVAGARRLAGSVAIYASPVTLRPQYNAVATGPAAAPEPDPRQMSLFCAAWTVASFKYLAEAGADGVTFFETAGGNGLMDAPGAPPRPGFHAVVGGVFPVWHVLADLGEFRGGAVVPSTSSHPLAVDCLALRLERRTRVLLANLTPEVQIVRLPGSARVRTLDAGNAEEAMGRPERFRGSARDAALSRGLPLEPYAVATLDLGAPAPAKEKQRR